jgi:hypothetical protein
MSVFKVDKNFKVILNPEAVKLVPELSSLTNDEMIFVILVMDYEDSPFRKKPLEERRALAIKRVFGDKPVNVDNKKIYDAMESYKSLVFDIRRETLDVYKLKAQLYHKEALNPDVEFKRIKELDQAIQFLEERIDKIQTSLEVDELNEFELKGQKKLSHVEVWQRRQKELRKFKETT